MLEHISRCCGHFRKIDQLLELGLVIQNQRRASNAAGVIGDSLEYGGDLGNRYHKPQVMGRGPLKRKYLDAQAVDLKLHLIDDLVFFDYRSSKVTVPLCEGLHGTMDCIFSRSTQ